MQTNWKPLHLTLGQCNFRTDLYLFLSAPRFVISFFSSVELPGAVIGGITLGFYWWDYPGLSLVGLSGAVIGGITRGCYWMDYLRLLLVGLPGAVIGGITWGCHWWDYPGLLLDVGHSRN